MRELPTKSALNDTKSSPHGHNLIPLQTSTSSKSIVKSIISKINNINNYNHHNNGIVDDVDQATAVIAPTPASPTDSSTHHHQRDRVVSSAATAISPKSSVRKPKTFHKSTNKEKSIRKLENVMPTEQYSTDEDEDGILSSRDKKKSDDKGGQKAQRSDMEPKFYKIDNNKRREEMQDSDSSSHEDQDDDMDDSLDSSLDSTSSEDRGILGPLEPISEEQSQRKDKVDIDDDDDNDDDDCAADDGREENRIGSSLDDEVNSTSSRDFDISDDTEKKSIHDNYNDDSDDRTISFRRSLTTNWSSSDEETEHYVDQTPLRSQASSMERSGVYSRSQNMKKSNKPKDDSTCCDEDFTWVKSESKLPVIEASPTKSTEPTIKSSTSSSSVGVVGGNGKPPRPVGSLDRRRHLSTNRQERDGKSRSAHSLKEKFDGKESKSSSTAVAKSGKNAITRAASLEGNGSSNNTDSGYQNEFHRGSPGFWEAPPPPNYPYPWEPPHPFWPSSCHASREELRMLDYQYQQHYHQQQHRRLPADHRYGSSGALNGSQHDLNYSGNYCNRYVPPPPPSLHGCCSCDLRPCHPHHSTSSLWSQRQDTDDRLRRLQSDKESLALQVQVLSEQLAAQGEKISDLERSLAEKQQQLNNADDLLRREMLSRSSLETQKLELMSAMSELKLQQAALERENLELRTNQLNNNITGSSNSIIRRPPLAPTRLASSSSAGSTPSPNNVGNSLNNSHPLSGSHGNLQQHQNNSITPKTPPSTYRRQIDLQYNSLPRQSFPTLVSTTNGNGTAAGDQQPVQQTTPKQRNVAFGKNHLDQLTSASTPAISSCPERNMTTFAKASHTDPDSGSLSASNNNVYHHQLVLYQPGQLKGFEKQRGFSVPNLAETEKVIEDTVDTQRSYTPQPSPSPSMSLKNKGLRGIFGKIKRSNSGNLEDLSGDGEFRRGGFRATAGARLGWSGMAKPDRPFDEWDIDSVCNWLDELGLSSYEDDARKWLKNGAVDLVKASPVDIEKELNLKNHLHRKKIVLALADVTGNETDELFKSAGKLDSGWMVRWLDDMGLPQHKDAFSLSRVDGRMLHKLTMEDLGHLHVTSCLHASSLRRGIQLMRENNFDPECLIRRSGGEPIHGPFKVQLWTAHRVMEWLRVVDLAEYAPNLRGAGVHGALMMYEPKFNAELLADLLSIPPSKTLLRRHLATHFKELLGREIIQGKRDVESVLGFQPLTLSAKLKTPKKSQFSLKRKKSTKGDNEWSDFVCPMGASGDHLPKNTTASSNNNSTMTNRQTQENPGAEVVSPLSNNHQSTDSNNNSNNNSNNVNASPTSSTRSSCS